MKKHSFFMAVLSMLLLISCNNNLVDTDKLQSGTGTVTINLDSSARTIGPNVDWNINDVKSWKVDIKGPSSRSEVFNGTSATYTLAVGSYTVVVESADSDLSYILTGTTSFEIKENGNSPISVFVGLKKSADVKCPNFEYTLSFDELLSEAPFTPKAYLYDIDNAKEILLDAKINLNSENQNLTESVTFSKKEINAGNYYLYIALISGDGTPVTVMVPLTDPFIELYNQEVIGEESITYDSLVQTIFVASDKKYKDAYYSGATAAYPAYLYDVLDQIREGELFEGYPDVTLESIDDSVFCLNISENLATGTSITVESIKSSQNKISFDANGNIVSCGYYSLKLQSNITENIELDISKFDEIDTENIKIILDGNITINFADRELDDYHLQLPASRKNSYFNTPIFKYESSIESISIPSYFIAPEGNSEGSYELMYDTVSSKEEGVVVVSCYIQPEFREPTVGVIAKLNSTTINSEEYFAHSNSDKVVLTSSVIGSEYVWINYKTKEILSKQSSFELSLSEYAELNSLGINCFVLSNNTFNNGKFTLQLVPQGLYLDTANDYFLYLDDEQLIKGRGLWMGDNQNKNAYPSTLGLSSSEISSASEQIQDVYNSLPKKPIFAADFNGEYRYGDAYLETKNDDNEFVETAITFDSANNRFIQTRDGITITYTQYQGNSIDKDDVTYGYDYCEANSIATLNEAVTKINSNSASSYGDCGGILFITGDIVVSSESVESGTESLAKFTNSVYISGKNYKENSVYKIATSDAGIRVFESNLGYYSSNFAVTNITLIGGTLAEDKNGGVIRFNTDYNNKNCYLYSGTTISGGKAVNGGGIYLGEKSSETLYVCDGVVIKDNTATSDGGGIYVCPNSYVYIYKGAQIGLEGHGNTAGGYGGGVRGSGISLEGGSISYNTAANGGGLYLTSYLYADRGIISNNTATTNGGGIYNNNGSVSIEDAVTLSNNTPENVYPVPDTE